MANEAYIAALVKSLQRDIDAQSNVPQSMWNKLNRGPDGMPVPDNTALFGQLNRDRNGMRPQSAPIMTMGSGMQNPSIPMGGGLGQMAPRGMGPMYPQMADRPAQGDVEAGPASMQQRPMMPAPQAPMPPQRPLDLPIAQQGAEMMPGAMGQIQGFNPTAAMGNAQAYADQFAGGDLAKIAARTYRNDDGTSWNDYFVR